MIKLLIFILIPSNCHAVKSVMEGIAATNNTIFVSTTNGRIGVSTNTPQAILDVAGNAQFGSTKKSTVSASGALNMAASEPISMSGPITGVSEIAVGKITGTSTSGGVAISSQTTIAGSTLTVQGNTLITGSISVSSNPFAYVQRANNLDTASGVNSLVYWDTVVTNDKAMINIVSSSDTVTIPAAEGGTYQITCSLQFNANATGRRIVEILVDGAAVLFGECTPGAAIYCTAYASAVKKLSAAQTVKCRGYQTSGGGLVILGGVTANYFTVLKLH